MFALFQELQRYIGFGQEDERALRELHPKVSADFPAVAELFYARVLEHEAARAALTRGEKHVGQLKGTLVRWMNELFQGPWDEAYVERRARIGRVHVQIALPQHYMVSAMNVVRVELRERITQLHDERSAEGRAARDALERICDLDLALMLHTYREDLEASQARSERLSTFGQLVGSIGHELRNPLVIETSLYVLKGRPSTDERTHKHLERIGNQVTLANDIITQLLDLIRDRPLSRDQVELGQLVIEALTDLPETQVSFARPAPIFVEGDATQLRQAVVNLAQNAAYFAGPQGRVEVALVATATGPVLTVDDSGPGIDPSIRNRLFEPLVSARPGGVGLGLALVRRVVERHHGTVLASRGPLGGARFTVHLPPQSEEGP